MKRRTHSTLGWMGIVWAASVMIAQASVVAQWTFTQNEDLSIAGGTATTDANLTGNAAVNTGSTGLGGNWAHLVKKGYYVGAGNTAEGGDDATQVRSVSTYSDFYGSASLVAGSFRMVVRSHFEGNAGGYPNDDWLFTLGDTYTGGSTPDYEYVQLAATGTGVGLTAFSEGGTTSAISLALPGGSGWDSGTWYYMAGSWGPGQTNVLMIREMDLSGPVGSPAAVTGTAAAALVLGGGTVPRYITVAGRSNNGGAVRPFDGDVALAEFYEEYMTLEQLGDGFHSLVVPEPGTVGLLGIGGLLLWVRRKRLIG